MRQEHAVSEVIGAVLLISVVILSMVVIGVMMLSTPPPDETPKASLTAYAIQCDNDDNYEVIIYHGGGEPMDLKNVKFTLYLSDGTREESIIPWAVYDGCTPEDCDAVTMETSSSLICPKEPYNPEGTWKTGQTFRFRENIPSPVQPLGIDILYYPFNSPMVKVNFKDQIKTSYCVEKNEPCRNPEDELKPVLIDPGSKSGGLCSATFQYHVHWDDPTYTYPITEGQKFRPWNFFKGNESPVTHSTFNNAGSDSVNIVVSYKDKVQWMLGRTKSEIARCE